MTLIRKSPFDRQEAAAEHMVTLLSEEADKQGTPLNEMEKEILASELGRAIPEDLRMRSCKLIEKIIEREKSTDNNDPKSFIASFEWASDNAYPQIVALTEEVITSGGLGHLPPLHGRSWIKDRTQLIGCGLLVVVFMLLIVGICGLVFERK